MWLCFCTALELSRYQQAPGSSHLSLSAQNPDFGPKKCNNLGQKSAMRYKDRHVVTIITCFWSNFFKNPQARGTISIQAVVKVRATNISFNHLPARNLVPHLLQSFFGRLLSERKPDRCTGTGDNVMCDRFSPQSCHPVVALKEILLCSIRTLINIEPNLFDNKRME